jgi:hypothetical protein
MVLSYQRFLGGNKENDHCFGRGHQILGHPVVFSGHFRQLLKTGIDCSGAKQRLAPPVRFVILLWVRVYVALNFLPHFIDAYLHF